MLKKQMAALQQFLADNIRFVLAALANLLALVAAIWWTIDSNLINPSDRIEIEPIVTTVTLTATLLGLNFVNNKLSKPLLKISISMSMTQHPIEGWVHGICFTVENHSIIKAFISSFKVEVPGTGKTIQFLREGFTGQILPKVALEPGQAFSFNVSKKDLSTAPQDPDAYGDFVVTTDVGHQFRAPASVFRKHFVTLNNINS